MDVHRVFCEEVVESIRLHLTNLKMDQESIMKNLHDTYEEQQRMLQNADERQHVMIVQHLQELQNTIQKTSDEHKVSMSLLSEQCILDAIQGSSAIEDSQEISQIKMHCRETLVDQLRSIQDLQLTERAMTALDEFLQDEEEKVDLPFPDVDVLNILAQINLSCHDIGSDVESDCSAGPISESD